jgi:hypothetical protein
MLSTREEVVGCIPCCCWTVDGWGDEVSGACFICDQQANDVLVISRLDRTAYDVPMCEALFDRNGRAVAVDSMGA